MCCVKNIVATSSRHNARAGLIVCVATRRPDRPDDEVWQEWEGPTDNAWRGYGQVYDYAAECEGAVKTQDVLQHDIGHQGSDGPTNMHSVAAVLRRPTGGATDLWSHDEGLTCCLVYHACQHSNCPGQAWRTPSILRSVDHTDHADLQDAAGRSAETQDVWDDEGSVSDHVS